MSEPTPADAVRKAAQRSAHDAAVERGELGYLDPLSRLFVLTSAALAERGYCCENGCRHCPYQDRQHQDRPDSDR